MLMWKLKTLALIFSVLLCNVYLTSCAVLSSGKTTPSEAVTTNIKDAYPIAHWMKDLLVGQTPQTGRSFNLAPGYYTFNIQSYCLKAGSYAPTAGSGYLMAPLKGDRATIITNILRRSVKYPNVQQQDIQRLIWGIETGANFSNYDASFQLKVSPLLSVEEIAILSVDYASWMSQILPDSIQGAVDFYQTLRDQVTSAQTSYEELERLAVRVGVAPMGPGSRDIEPGAWAYTGNGYYMRAFPSGYTKTRLEIIRPAHYTLERDAKGRIIVFKSADYRIETDYDDSAGANIVSAPGKSDRAIWRFKKIRFIGSKSTEELIIKNKGWILASKRQRAMQAILLPSGNTRLIQLASLENGMNYVQQDNSVFDLWQEVNERYEQAQDVNDFIEQLKDYRKEYDRAERPVNEQAINDFTDVQHYRDGLEVATDLKQRSKWLGEHMRRLLSAMHYITCLLAGDCVPSDGQADTVEFDPSHKVATPANVSRQRLGLSKRLQ